jgi:hypothetical protein
MTFTQHLLKHTKTIKIGNSLELIVLSVVPHLTAASGVVILSGSPLMRLMVVIHKISLEECTMTFELDISF